jgi:crossover junction endodeoxyribonuclease RuvC
MLMTLLAIKEAPKLLDATDALAVAVCHHFQHGLLKGKSKSWAAYLKENPSRIKVIGKL